jgi:hypothetical protein
MGMWIGSEFLGAKRERRFILYGILRELKPEMSRADVDFIIQRHQAPFIKYYGDLNNVSLTINYLPAQSLSLLIHFDEAKLSKAYIIGEDGPHDIPNDAPKLE